MKKDVARIVEDIKIDRNLCPYFVDYIGENLKTKFGSRLEIQRPDGLTFDQVADVKLDVLVSQLRTKVPPKHLQIVLDEVCRYYVSMVGLAF